MPDKKIKYVDIVFENCEAARLKPSEFGCLIIDGIYKKYCINCFQYEKGEVCEFIKCKEFYIVINVKGMMVKTLEGELLKDRIKSSNDITHIDLVFTDKTNEYITVPWGKKEYENEKQKVKITKDGIEIIINAR